MAKILDATPENLALALSALEQGQVVAIPTETVYGLAANAFNAAAVAQVFQIKERPTFDPLIVHVKPMPCQNILADLEKSQIISTSYLSAEAKRVITRLAELFWPGPLTLVLPKHEKIPDLVTSGLNSIAVRMPKHELAQKLLSALKFPLAAPSANRFGRISPTNAIDVEKELGSRIQLILDGGPCEVGLESSVLKVKESGSIQILRHGGVAIEQLQKEFGKDAIETATSATSLSPEAPGALENHYAPQKPLYLLPFRLEDLGEESKKLQFQSFVYEILKANKSKLKNKTLSLGLLVMRGDASWNMSFFKQVATEVLKDNPALSISGLKHIHTEVLSVKGDAVESAKNLFSAFRKMDESPADLLLSEPCFDKRGIGLAIADRIQKASVKTIMIP